MTRSDQTFPQPFRPVLKAVLVGVILVGEYRCRDDHPGLLGGDGLVHFHHGLGDGVSAVVVPRPFQLSPQCHTVLFGKGDGVGRGELQGIVTVLCLERFAGFRVVAVAAACIADIVEVDPVHVIVSRDFCRVGRDVRTHRGQGRLEHQARQVGGDVGGQPAEVLEQRASVGGVGDEFGTGVHDVHRIAGPRAETSQDQSVDPGVHFDTFGVGEFDDVCQGVETCTTCGDRGYSSERTTVSPPAVTCTISTLAPITLARLNMKSMFALLYMSVRTTHKARASSTGSA